MRLHAAIQRPRKLYPRFKDPGLVVLGFPANDFARQEPGTNRRSDLLPTDYPVTFPMFSKITVTGPDTHPLYQRAHRRTAPSREFDDDAFREDLAGFLKSQNLPGPNDPPELLWNFEKFLIGRNGNVVARFSSDVAPDDPRLISAIEPALNAA